MASGTDIDHRLFVGGTWRTSSDERTLSVTDPSTMKAIGDVADASPADGDAAAAAAAEAQRSWADVPSRHRAELLRAAYAAMQDSREELAAIITQENGKPLKESRGEVGYASDFFRWFSEVAAHIDGSQRSKAAGGGLISVSREPVGPSLLITPWNFPAAMVTRKIAPAMAAGCTSILKPAAQTPLTALAMARILRDVGIPDGVVNVLPTSRAAEVTHAIVASGHIRKLSFTGSTEVGRELLALASGSVLRTSMELGGNAPFIVFDDADLDAAVEGAVVAKLRNAGQSCVAANRFYVHRSVADEFTTALSARFTSMQVGAGAEATTDVGPLIDRQAFDRVTGLIQHLENSGARILGRTQRDFARPGNFVEPVIADLGDRHDLLGDSEVFGPVAPVMTFDAEADVIERANATRFGLVAFAYTTDLARAERMSRALDVGMVGLNTGLVSDASAPFGGVKHSGLGREGGAEGISEFLETKYIALPT